MADDAGALLVRSGLVTASALEDARARVDAQGGTLGEQLVAADVLSDDALTEFYTSRLLVPRVNPNLLARLPASVVGAIPAEMAIELRAVPVSLDADGNLTVAMGDPSDRHAADEIALASGRYVVRAVATQLQLAWCLAHYYGHVTALCQRLLQTSANEPAVRRAVEASAARPRLRGATGQIAAARRHAIVPGAVAAEPAIGAAASPAADVDPPTPPEPRAHRDTLQEEPVEAAIPTARARSVSGEIRVPSRRASSIKPPLDDGELVEVAPELSEPTITIEAGEPADEPLADEPTGRTRPAPRRRRAVKSDPPELAARAGEVDITTGRIAKVELDDEPRVVVAPEVSGIREVSGELVIARTPRNISVEAAEESSAVVIHEQMPIESQPILLDRRRPSEPPTAGAPLAPRASAAAPDGDDVVVLASRKTAARPATRPERRTQIGIGANAATTRGPDDTPVDAPVDDDPTRIDQPVAPTIDDGSSSDVLAAPPSPITDDDTSPHIAPPSARAAEPKPSGKVILDHVVARAPSDDDDDDDELAAKFVPRGSATRVMSALELDDAIPQRRAEPVPAHLARHVDYDPVDDGWGPPGTTIPPPLLGAIPGSVTPARGVFPIANPDSAPLVIAPPSPPEQRAVTSEPSGGRSEVVARALEDAMARTLDLIRTLEHAVDRDEVVAVMIAHLGESHRRAGFFAVRAGELTLFEMRPRPAVLPFATLRLDRPSTLQDVVGTRLPYRGPMDDDASQMFMATALGACPPEILLVPVSLRERVVGVLFGEQRAKHTFDDQLALAARAAGSALERILKSKRG